MATILAIPNVPHHQYFDHPGPRLPPLDLSVPTSRPKTFTQPRPNIAESPTTSLPPDHIASHPDNPFYSLSAQQAATNRDNTWSQRHGMLHAAEAPFDRDMASRQDTTQKLAEAAPQRPLQDALSARFPFQPPDSSSSTTNPTTKIMPPATGPPNVPPKGRVSLHLRQQPRAARAGPDGKDRRTIDPPPVLQLLVDDFNADDDLPILRANDWVVHARLVSAETPAEDLTTVMSHTESGRKDKMIRLLLGTVVSGPHFCAKDPDPDTAPKHPATSEPAPPSPTMRFIQTSRSSTRGTDPHKRYPAVFFIFADLSIRKAGQYRLEFRLMKMDPKYLITGSIVPTVSIAVSDVFNVVNAKDFDQVQPSTNLIKGLLDSGAGFPLKLKKGNRETSKRKTRTDDSDSDDEDVAHDDNTTIEVDEDDEDG